MRGDRDKINGSIKNRRSKKKEPFSFANVKRIFLKDWKELRRNRELFWPIVLLPIMFAVIMPLLLGIGVVIAPEEFLPGATSYYAMDFFVVKLMLKPMFMLIPIIVCMIIAADSFAGEKERKTAESLLLLPITHKELYLGKMFTALIPAIIFSVLSFFIMGIVTNLMVFSDIQAGMPLLIFSDVSFWLLAFVLSVSFSTISVQAGIIISSRSKNMKSAQSVSGIMIIPILGIGYIPNFFGTWVNDPFIFDNIIFILIFSAFLWVIIYLMIIFGQKIINREKLIANIE